MSLRTIIVVHNVSIQILVMVALAALMLQGCPKKPVEEPQPRVYELPALDTALSDLPDGEGQ